MAKASNRASNNERRVTVLRSLWPRLQALAERDGVHVGDVINAILLQTLGPYGTAAPCSCNSPATASSPTVIPTKSTPNQPDPYEVASVETW